jgi:hypothetical protein
VSVRKITIRRRDSGVIVSDADVPETCYPAEEVSVQHQSAGTEPGQPVDRDVVPDDVVARAKAAFATRAAGALAALVSDSALNAGPPTEARTLRFVHPSVSVKICVTGQGVWRTISGRVVPGRLRVRLEREGAEVAPVHDVERGSFGFTPMPRGLVRLWLDEPDGSTSVRTEWFLV